MHLDPQVVAVSMAAVMAIGFMKGAFGGGFAIIGIPLLAPLFVAMDGLPSASGPDGSYTGA